MLAKKKPKHEFVSTFTNISHIGPFREKKKKKSLLIELLADLLVTSTSDALLVGNYLGRRRELVVYI